jgi:integrase
LLTIYRRHTRICGHRKKGRRHHHCRCPIWVQGTLAGEDIRRSTALQNWQKAHELLREWEVSGRQPEEQPEIVTVHFACDRFLEDAAARGLAESTMKKYTQLTKQMTAFAESHRKVNVDDWNLQVVRQFRASWKDGARSSLKKLERLRAFFRFALDSKWVADNPARKLKNPTVRPNPTLPFDGEEVMRILAACAHYTDAYGRVGQPNAKKLRALVLLLRYSGLRIGDASSCAVDRLQGDRLLLHMHKTGHPVHVKLPSFVVDALNSIPRSSERYWFWTGAGKVDNNTETWRRKLRRLFSLAGVKDAHPHRFRDTFSVELLLAAVPIEQVSVLLGHESVRITERSYAPWVKARQERLDADLERAWGQDPIVLAETEGTREVHAEHETVN